MRRSTVLSLPLQLVFPDLAQVSPFQYRKTKIDCLRFVMCPLLAPVFQGFFLVATMHSANETNRQAKCTINQSILPRCLWDSPSYLKFVHRWLASFNTACKHAQATRCPIH